MGRLDGKVLCRIVGVMWGFGRYLVGETGGCRIWGKNRCHVKERRGVKRDLMWGGEEI